MMLSTFALGANANGGDTAGTALVPLPAGSTAGVAPVAAVAAGAVGAAGFALDEQAASAPTALATHTNEIGVGFMRAH